MAISRCKEDLGQLSLDGQLYRERYGTLAGNCFVGSVKKETSLDTHAEEPQTQDAATESTFPKQDENPFLNEAYAEHLVKNGKAEIKLLIVGRVGYGKSALINTLFEGNVVKEGDSAHSVTKKVSCHTYSIHGIKVTIADTPGFFGTDKDSQDIVSEIKENMKDVDLILFCIKMPERFSESEKQLIRIIRKNYNKTVLLRNTIFALTFANEVKVSRYSSVALPEHFDNKLQEMRTAIASAVEQYGKLTNQEASQIPVVPVGYDKRELPTVKDWFVPFWYYCFKRTNDVTKAALLAIGIEQIASSTIHDDSVSLNRSDVFKLEDLARNDEHPGEGSFFLLRVIEKLKEFFGLK